MHPRAQLRADARTALAAPDVLPGVRVLAGWAQDFDADLLPALGVYTPRTFSRPASSVDMLRNTQLVVHLRRLGSEDLDDQLDLDSAAIEAAIQPVIDAWGAGECYLEATDVEIQSDAGHRLGKLTMTFQAGRFSPVGNSQ